MPLAKKPLWSTMTCRFGDLTRDELMSNAYVDVLDQDQAWLVKRPGLGTPRSAGVTNNPRGMFNQVKSPNVFFAVGNGIYAKMNSSPTLVTSTTASNLERFFAVEDSNGNILTMSPTGLGASTEAYYIPYSVGGPWSPTVPASLTTVLTGSSGAVSGLEYLDGYAVYYGADGKVYNSNFNDFTTWNVLNFVQPIQEPGQPVALTKYKNYLVCFKTNSTEFLYDAGNPSPGSPFSVYQAASFRIGCARDRTVTKIADTVIWVGQTEDGSPGVYMLDGLQPSKISNPSVDYFLQTINSGVSVQSYGMTWNGHYFYFLATGQVTLVFDITTKLWGQWTNGQTSMFLGFATADTNSPTLNFSYIQGSDGLLYLLSDTFFDDNGTTIYMGYRTANMDFGTQRRKYLREIQINADQSYVGLGSPTTLQYRYSYNDYASWSAYRNIQIGGTNRKSSNNLGSFRRGAFEFLYTGFSRFRMAYVEFDIDTGEN